MGRAKGAKDLLPQMRSRICELSTLRYTPTQILRIYPELKLSTIKLTIKHERLRVDNVSRPRPGRSRILSEEQRDRVYDIVSYKDPHIKMRDLLREVDNAVKKRTMQTLLREMNLKKWL
jgi:transposase